MKKKDLYANLTVIKFNLRELFLYKAAAVGLLVY